MKGRTGPLCGSCTAGHGRRGSECLRCFPDGLIVFLFFCSLAWFLIVVGIGVKGNLSSTYVDRGPSLEKPQGSLVRPHQHVGPLQEAPTLALLKGNVLSVNPNLYEVAGSNQASGSETVRVTMPGRKNLLARRKRCQATRLAPLPERDLALRTIAETFKVLLIQLSEFTRVFIRCLSTLLKSTAWLSH